MNLSDLRRDFGKFGLDEGKLPDEPIDLLMSWLSEAKNAQILEYNAMVLSTVDHTGKPSSRIVLLKEIKNDGLIFYSNYLSRKAKEIMLNPNVAVNFFWRELEKQVRIEGKITKTSREDSGDYFKSRPLESQLSAIVSPQSEVISGLGELKKETEELFVSGRKIKLPIFWGGYFITPELFEFWQGGKNRFHDRIRYKLTGGKWEKDRLAP